MDVKLWIAMYVNHGETCDGKPRLLDVCKSRAEALVAVRADMEKWKDARVGMPLVVDFDKMSAKYSFETFNDTDSCEWYIEERLCSFNEDNVIVMTTADDTRLEFDFA